MSNEPCPFLAFSLRYYALPDVAPALLRLQDEAGADVNIVLFGLWRASERLALSAREFSTLDERVRAWRERVVHPLRAVRRFTKQPGPPFGESATLYPQAKQVELEAELIQQRVMYAEGETLAPGSSVADMGQAARLNLATYAELLQTPFPDSVVAFLQASLDTLASAPQRRSRG